MTTTSILVGSGGGSAYTIPKSLRFRAPSTTYMNRTPGSATNQTVWTLSAWVKRGTTGTLQTIFNAFTGSTNYSTINFTTSDQIQIANNVAGTLVTNKITSSQYQDCTGWYHIVVSSNGSSSLNLYVNGVQVTSFGTNVGPTAGNWFFNGANVHNIGRDASSGTPAQYFDAAMAEFNWIDGQALAASSFGTYDTNGVWQPIIYSGTYGTNGFYLNFGNTTSTTTLGYDTSGNANNWTTNNFSLTTPGFDYDSLTDTPTSYSASVSNYCVLNQLYTGSGLAPDYAGMRITSAAGAWRNTVGTVGMSTGKWYFEAKITAITTGVMVGICVNTFNVNENYTSAAKSWSYYSTGSKFGNSANSAYGASYTAGDIIGVLFDADAATLTFYKNNTSQGVAFTSFTGYPAGTTFFPYVGIYNATVQVNFGQQPYTYTPPTGAKSFNTYNLPTAPIANGAQYMAATTYTGTGATQTISDGTNTAIGTTFQPDFVWLKSRSAATDHALYDVVRGTTLDLASNTTAAETTQSTGLTAFGSTGFTIGALAKINTNAATYVGWQWKANGAGVTNTNGSITSTVSANTTAGFSIVGYTGNATAGATVGHGLGVAPSFIIVKDRAGATSWAVYHASLGATNWLLLNNTQATTVSSQEWNNTAPTSTVFSVGNSSSNSNQSAANIAYCWAAVPGYSAFGNYLGNANANGWFVYTGFRPRFLLIKASSTTSDWLLMDSSRNTYNVSNGSLYANTSGAEVTNAAAVDFCAAGFVMKNATFFNANGATFVYAAFAENPFNTARAR